MTSAVIGPETKDTTPSLTVTVNRLSISSSPFPSPGSPFFPPPILSPHEYAVMSSTTKRRSTDSRMNAGNNTGSNHESAHPSAHQNHPATPTVTAAGLAAGKPSTTESQDRKPAAGDDKKDKGADLSGRGADQDVICLSNGNINGGVDVDPLVPASPATLQSESVLRPTQPPCATVPPNVDSNGVDDVPLSESPPTTPLASNQNTPTTIIQPSSPPSTSSPAPTDPTRASPLDGLRSSRNSLTSSRPAPPSPATSRRASGALSRCSSTRSRPNSTPAGASANPPEPDANANADSTTSAKTGAASPTTPTPQHQTHKSCVKIRDFGFPDDDPRHTGLGPLTPRPNRRIQRPLSAWSASSTSSTSSNDDGDDPASSSAGGGSSYGFAGWGLGRLSWFGVPSGAGGGASGGGSGSSSGGAGGPSQGDFERNFEDAVSPSYEIDDPYASLDDDDDFDDYEDSVGADDQVGEGDGEDNVERPLFPGMYRALYAFEPEGTAEMALEEDQIVRVVGRGGGVGWAIVARGGDEGHALVPEGYLELVSLDQEQEQLGEEDG